jgi:hypothetical protein
MPGRESINACPNAGRPVHRNVELNIYQVEQDREEMGLDGCGSGKTLSGAISMH